jgi:NAD+ synthase (glutamine-hydrolysing)
MTLADIDVRRLNHDRIVSKSFGENAATVLKGYTYRNVAMNLESHTPIDLLRPITVHPFTSENPAKQKYIVDTIFDIQVNALIKRLEYIERKYGIKKVVLGLSGGKDSTLAYLVCVKAFEQMLRPLSDIHAYSMPGPGTSDSTKNLSKKLGPLTSFEEIDITEGVNVILRKIKHGGKQDVTFENAQARFRTLLLFQKANQIGALVIGTGDLSEIANGFCTFNGDHISGYNVNCGVPKGLVKYMLAYSILRFKEGKLRVVLRGIMEHPDSPELTRSGTGKITQITEEKVGPYELAEFFLYEFVRWGSEPKKIFYLGSLGFKGKHTPATIKKWLMSFYIRFFDNQWKRSVAADGPQVGSISLSPRGKWRMPSDAEVDMWLDELK